MPLLTPDQSGEQDASVDDQAQGLTVFLALNVVPDLLFVEITASLERWPIDAHDLEVSIRCRLQLHPVLDPSQNAFCPLPRVVAIEMETLYGVV